MAKNTHLEHLEDDIVNQGKARWISMLSKCYVRDLGKMLSEPAFIHS